MASSKTTTFYIPKKNILTKQDLEAFQLSEAYKEYVGFVNELNYAVIGKKTTEKVLESEVSG